MVILGIETSCDETAAAVVQKTGDRVIILSNIVASSASLQAKYGGVIPEQAAREQIKSIIPVIKEALNQAFPSVIPANAGIQSKKSSSELDPRLRGDDNIERVDAIAVTYGPGLIGSLLVGVETAKALAVVWKKPLIPVNHLIGHFYANWVDESVASSKYYVARGNKKVSHTTNYQLPTTPQFPAIGLLVSGGHTDLVLFKEHGKYEYLGGTRDDAAGECFDKCARLLGLPYPGGPQISKLAQNGNPQAFDLPRPMMKDFSSRGRPASGWDFSFSGLKTAVANLIRDFSVIPANAGIQSKKSSSELDPRLRGDDKKKITDLAASIQQAIVDVLVAKTIKAAQTYKVDQIIVAGGVAANQQLASDLKLKIENLKLRIKLHIPPPELCTDNAVMIAAAAFFHYHPIDPFALQVNPNLSFTNS